MAKQELLHSKELTPPQPLQADSIAYPQSSGVDATRDTKENKTESTERDATVSTVDSTAVPQLSKAEETPEARETEIESANGETAANAADSTPRMPPQVSVFGTIELLEQILLSIDSADHVGDGNGCIISAPDGSKHSRWSIEPEMSLFVLQRVSKGFRDVIQDSVKLRRKMFLAPLSIPNGEPTNRDDEASLLWPTHQPLSWFVKESRCWDPWIHGLEQGDRYKLEVGFNWSYALGWEDGNPFPTGGSSADASWRQIKVCNAKDPISISLKLDFDHLLGSLEGDSWDPLLHQLVWNLSPDETLGGFSDRLWKLAMTWSELQTKNEEVYKRRRLEDEEISKKRGEEDEESSGQIREMLNQV